MSTTLGLALPPAFPLVGLGVVSLTFLNVSVETHPDLYQDFVR